MTDLGTQPAGAAERVDAASADNARPVDTLPPSGLPAGAVAAGFLVLAVALFIFLEGRRHEAEGAHRKQPSLNQDAEVANGPAVPPLVIPAPPPAPAPVATPLSPTRPTPQVRYIERPAPPPPPPVIQYVERPAAPGPPPSPQGGRLAEPALVVDLQDPATGQKGEPAEEFSARAVVLHNRALLVPQGTLIPAVLETPIDSTRPGPVRAITSTETRGFDGTRVLIPRGSRLVGDYRSDVEEGQKRVLITWNRLVRPDGVAIRLTSPAADSSGQPGVPGEVNNHLLARVGSVVLQSALAVGVNLAARPGNGSVVIETPAQSFASAGQTLIPTGSLKPEIKVREGAQISVFVLHDLNFAGATPRP